MDFSLSPTEVRVLGSLIEKELTTPDYYPLTLNALTAACNQKSNREPVLSINDGTVIQALNALREKKLAWQLETAGGRVPKFANRFREVFDFTPPEVAILCELFVRGPQTIGELRVHASRLHEFADLASVEGTLRQLTERQGGPFICKLPRRPGCKEARYSHLFSGPVGQDEAVAQIQQESVAGADTQGENPRIAALERAVAELRTEIAQIKECLAKQCNTHV